MPPIAPALRSVFVATANHVQQFPLGSLINRTQRAGWGYLFSDVYTTGAINRPTLETAARAVARGVRQGYITETEGVRTGIVGDLMQPSRLQEARFSPNVTDLLAALRRKFSDAYGTKSVEEALDKLVAVEPEWGPFFTSAHLLTDRIVEDRGRPHQRRENLLGTLRRIVESHALGLAPDFLGRQLAFFHARLGQKGRLSDIITTNLKREKARLAQPARETEPVQSIDESLAILSRVLGRPVTIEEINRSVRTAMKHKKTDSSRIQIIAVETTSLGTFVTVEALEQSSIGSSGRLPSTLRMEIIPGRRLDPTKTKMIPFNSFILSRDNTSNSTPGLEGAYRSLPTLEETERRMH